MCVVNITEIGSRREKEYDSTGFSIPSGINHHSIQYTL